MISPKFYKIRHALLYGLTSKLVNYKFMSLWWRLALGDGGRSSDLRSKKRKKIFFGENIMPIAYFLFFSISPKSKWIMDVM
jgi:hypothetical protein